MNPTKIALSIINIEYACDQLFKNCIRAGLTKEGNKTLIAGIPRGGIPAAYALAASYPQYFKVVGLQDAEYLVDDLADTGKTRETYRKRFRKPVMVLFTKRQAADEQEGLKLYGAAVPPHQWLVFPWEASEAGSAEDIPIRLLQFIGEDPMREGLKDTPGRFIKAWKEWAAGYQIDPADILKSFKDGAEKIDEMIVVRDIAIYSHCEHHLAPFFGVAHVGYVPNGRIVGLSKIPKLVDAFASRLQVQERLTAQIADAMMEHLKCRGVGVVIECRHLCMESRGIRKAGTTTLTSVMRGVMMDKPEARAELMALSRRRG